MPGTGLRSTTRQDLLVYQRERHRGAPWRYKKSVATATYNVHLTSCEAHFDSGHGTGT